MQYLTTCLTVCGDVVLISSMSAEHFLLYLVCFVGKLDTSKLLLNLGIVGKILKGSVCFPAVFDAARESLRLQHAHQPHGDERSR